MSLIIPEVYAPLVREKFLGKVKLLNLSVNVGVLKNTNIGDTITFPKWKTLTDANIVVKGTPSAIDSLDQDSSTATIKMIDKIVRVFDIDDMTVLGSSIQEAAAQQAIVFARHMDADLITEASTTPLKTAVAGATAITATELNNGILNFGDDADVDLIGGIVIHSLVSSSFYAMPEFVDITKTYNQNGNGIVRGGVIGYFRGIPVIMSDRCYDTTLSEAKTFIIKKNALGYMEKTAINIVEEREEKLHCSDIVGSYTYAVKRLDDAGIVMLKKTIA